MPQASNISIADGAVAPVTHVFTVIKPQNDDSPSEFRDLTRTVREQQVQITELVTRAKGNSNRDKVKTQITIPILRTDATGTTRVVDWATLRCDYTVPQICTDAEKQDLFAFAKNLASHSSVQSGVVDSLPQY